MAIDDLSIFHPSIKDTLANIKERGHRSPFAFVEYSCNDGSGCTHMELLGDGINNVFEQDPGLSFESICLDLADSMLDSNLHNRNGKKVEHDSKQAQNAIAAAMKQLQTWQYDRMWFELDWLIKGYKKWGGNVPAAVLTPDEEDIGRWAAIVPDENADPVKYMVKKDSPALNEILIPPDPDLVVPNPYYGWEMRRSYRQQAADRIRSVKMRRRHIRKESSNAQP